MKESFNDRIALAAEIAEAKSLNSADIAREIHQLRLQKEKIQYENEKMKSFMQRWINSVDVSYAWDQKQLSKECGDFISGLNK